jgi:hypothetical protein
VLTGFCNLWYAFGVRLPRSGLHRKVSRLRGTRFWWGREGWRRWEGRQEAPRMRGRLKQPSDRHGAFYAHRTVSWLLLYLYKGDRQCMQGCGGAYDTLGNDDSVGSYAVITVELDTAPTTRQPCLHFRQTQNYFELTFTKLRL